MTGPQVCETLGLAQSTLQRIVAAGIVEPSDGGGGRRGQQQRWNERDLPLLMIVNLLLASGAAPRTAQRVVQFLHTMRRAPFGSILIVGPTFGPTIASPERSGTAIVGAGEAVTVLALDLVRKSLREQGLKW